jgi:hypothetical protein
MSRAIAFTKAQLKRAIEAARESGYRVKGIAPDGTILLEERGNNSQPDDRSDDPGHEVVY